MAPIDFGDDGGPSSGAEVDETTTAGVAPPATSVGPATSPAGDSTVGPTDTGVLDTGEVLLDLPEHCSTIEQDCPPGFKCMPYSSDGGSAWNDTKCVPIVPDPSAVGEACTVEGSGVSGVDDCDGTSMCWYVEPETNEGTCVAFCIGDENEPTCADSCANCTLSGDGILTLCLDGCDPVAQDCEAGQGCYPTSYGFVCVPDASAGDTGIGSPCEYINACPVGMVCLAANAVPGCDLSGVGCCTPACGVGGLDPCPGVLPGSECVPWFEEGWGPPEACVIAEPGVCAAP